LLTIVDRCRLGTVQLFDYSKQRAAAIDEASGGLHGIRLPDGRLTGVSADEYYKYSCRHDGRTPEQELNKDVDRRLCVSLAAQNLILLDAFLFPESLDNSLPGSQLHGLPLVRNSEARLGSSQGPLLSSAIRLSFLLLAFLEPCSVKFLQCASRLRCLLGWALELVQELSEENTPVFSEGTAHIDRLLLAILLHCHRALGRCAALLCEIESSSYAQYFDSKETQKKHHRRLLRAALELRDIVSTIFRGRDGVLKLTLSSEAFEALRLSLESEPQSPGKHHNSKEAVVREFLSSKWVEGFQDVETRFELIVPEQVSMETIPLDNDGAEAAIVQGIVIIEKLSKETNDILVDFEKALDSCFNNYLEAQRKWAETDAVRELEYEGDTTAKKLTERQKNDTSDFAKEAAMRRNGVENRWRTTELHVVDPWKDRAYWKLPKYADRLGRRMVLIENKEFNSHADASYESTLGAENNEKKEEEQSELQKHDLAEVMRRNAEAFALHEMSDDGEVTDDDSSQQQASDGESSVEFDETETETDSEHNTTVDDSVLRKFDTDASWDKITSDDVGGFDDEGDADGWAKAFVWSEGETVVAHFEPVMTISLQTYVEGKLLLTTHNLYFLQTSAEINIMTKESVQNVDNLPFEVRGRRWRLSRLTELHGRRYLLRPQALELFFSDGNELLINFPSGSKERDRFHTKLRNNCKVRSIFGDQLQVCKRYANSKKLCLGSHAVVAKVPEPQNSVS